MFISGTVSYQRGSGHVIPMQVYIENNILFVDHCGNCGNWIYNGHKKILIICPYIVFSNVFIFCDVPM